MGLDSTLNPNFTDLIKVDLPLTICLERTHYK